MKPVSTLERKLVSFALLPVDLFKDKWEIEGELHYEVDGVEVRPIPHESGHVLFTGYEKGMRNVKVWGPNYEPVVLQLDLSKKMALEREARVALRASKSYPVPDCSAVIGGRVVRKSNGALVEGVEISMEGDGNTAVSGADGSYQLCIRSAPWEKKDVWFVAKKEGYGNYRKKHEVVQGAVTQVEIRM